MALAAIPFAAQAETWNIYGWQNHSWEFVDIDEGRSFDRIQSNAGNIGFAASVDTGMNGISVNVQCEQFMYVNHFAGGTGWCNRNSKIGLSHPQMGEIMLATWLLPYNEGVAQWVDPFYDAGADSHTSIMGSVGAQTIFYNTGDFDIQASGDYGGKALSTGSFTGHEFNYSGGGYDTGFNRRQENIIQYWSPNWNGFVFRFAWTAGNRDEKTSINDHEIDPVIRSSSLAYTNGPLWLAVTWQDHEDWTVASVGEMESSDAESFRVAGRYIMDLGDGMSVQISAMWEDLEYEFNGVSNVDAAMAAFGYTNFGTYDLFHNGSKIVETPAVEAMDAVYSEFDAESEAGMEAIMAQKTLGLFYELFGNPPATETAGVTLPLDNDLVTVTDEDGNTVDAPTFTSPTTLAVKDNPLTAKDETAAAEGGTDLAEMVPEEYLAAFKRTAMADAPEPVDANGDGTNDNQAAIDAHANAVHQYQLLVDKATEAAMEAFEPELVTAAVDGKDAVSAADNRAAMTAGQNVKIERDAWMVSGKIKMGGPIDFRFSYMDADDLEVSCTSCSGDWDETAADAWNVGIFYTMPAGTELRLTYSEVDNDNNGTYGQGISGTGLGTAGAEIEMFAVGIVHWFD